MLQETDWIEILQTSLSLKTKQSSGYDVDEVSTLKINLALSISVSSAHIINLSFNTGIVPKKLKLAKVVPTF